MKQQSRFFLRTIDITHQSLPENDKTYGIREQLMFRIFSTVVKNNCANNWKTRKCLKCEQKTCYQDVKVFFRISLSEFELSTLFAGIDSPVFFHFNSWISTDNPEHKKKF